MVTVLVCTVCDTAPDDTADNIRAGYPFTRTVLMLEEMVQPMVAVVTAAILTMLVGESCLVAVAVTCCILCL